MSIHKPLRFRLLGITVLIVLIMSAAMLFVISQMYQVRIHQEYVNKGLAAARMAACLVDGEMVDKYLDSLEKDKGYAQMVTHLKTLQKGYGLKYVYVSRVVEGGSIYVFDTDEVSGSDLGEFSSWLDDWGQGFDELHKALMRGERIEPVVDKSEKWGHLLTIYEPIVRADGSVAAYAGVDISMEYIFKERIYALTALGIAVPLLILFFSVLHHLAIRRLLIAPVSTLAEEVSAFMPPSSGETPPERETGEGDEIETLHIAITEMKSRIDNTMHELKKAEEHNQIMLDTTPLSCHMWDSNFNIIDCSESAFRLFESKDKQDFLKRFFEFSPEYQTDGQPSREKALAYLKKAFEEGGFTFEWMHQMLDGRPMPTEVTMVRIGHPGDDDIVVLAYTRDLRQIKNLEKNIHRLEIEADKAYHDALTGLYNRRFFDEHLKQIIKFLSRSGSPLSLMMIDVDHFKGYNDTYGHAQGDVCLKKIAEALSQSVTRANDFVARYGGEEFSIVLPNTDERGARLLADKLLASILGCQIPHAKNDEAGGLVTISIGVTTGRVKHTHRTEDYVKRADELLYKSKKGGRNRYTFENL